MCTLCTHVSFNNFSIIACGARRTCVNRRPTYLDMLTRWDRSCRRWWSFTVGAGQFWRSPRHRSRPITVLSVNDLPDKITSEVRLFADDCVMYRSIHENSDVESFQADLNTLSLWQDTWQMQFNAKKCYVLKITHSRSQTNHQYRLGDSILQETD